MNRIDERSVPVYSNVSSSKKQIVQNMTIKWDSTTWTHGILIGTNGVVFATIVYTFSALPLCDTCQWEKWQIYQKIFLFLFEDSLFHQLCDLQNFRKELDAVLIFLLQITWLDRIKLYG